MKASCLKFTNRIEQSWRSMFRPVPGSESYKKADIPPTSYINEKGRIVDKTDYPFVNDPKVVGGWKTVDFVREIEASSIPLRKAGEVNFGSIILFLKKAVLCPAVDKHGQKVWCLVMIPQASISSRK